MRDLLLFIITIAMIIPGCTRAISEQARKLVDTDATFIQLKESPEKYIGRNVMLGGRIASLRNTSEGSQLEIVNFNLSDNGLPEETFISQGRFLATTGDYLDGMIFRKGMLITLVGEIKGKKVQRLDEMEYIYPVVRMREWHLWEGTGWDRMPLYPPSPTMYDPYFYGYGYEPYWYRPYGPPARPW